MIVRMFPCLLVLVACGTEVNDAPVEPGAEPAVAIEETDESSVFEAPDVEECDAEVFRSAIGVDVATTAFTPSPDLRIFSEADLVTQEYLPKRTNIVTDVNGVITRVYCG